MMTEQQVFQLEHEIRWWHAHCQDRATPCPDPAPTMFSPIVAPLRRFWTRWFGSAEQAEMVTVLRLELLRAVARGEISPETAQRVLSARP